MRTTLGYMPARDHYMCKLEQITDVVGLDDLTNSELAALAAVLNPAHARALAWSDDAATVERLRNRVGALRAELSDSTWTAEELRALVALLESIATARQIRGVEAVDALPPGVIRLDDRRRDRSG